MEAKLQVFVQLSHSPAWVLLPVRARGTAELILGPCSVTTPASRAGSWRVLGAAPWGVQRFGSQDLIGVVLPGPGAFLGRASPPTHGHPTSHRAQTLLGNLLGTAGAHSNGQHRLVQREAWPCTAAEPDITAASLWGVGAAAVRFRHSQSSLREKLGDLRAAPPVWLRWPQPIPVHLGGIRI